jgi:hypothetical protein
MGTPQSGQIIGLASAISNNLNEAERSPGRIAATPNPHYFFGQIVNPSRIAEFSMSEYPRLFAAHAPIAADAIPDSSIRPELLIQRIV